MENQLKLMIKDYKSEDIFNADETGLGKSAKPRCFIRIDMSNLGVY